jgi:hypothetical protein
VVWLRTATGGLSVGSKVGHIHTYKNTQHRSIPLISDNLYILFYFIQLQCATRGMLMPHVRCASVKEPARTQDTEALAAFTSKVITTAPILVAGVSLEYTGIQTASKFANNRVGLLSACLPLFYGMLPLSVAIVCAYLLRHRHQIKFVDASISSFTFPASILATAAMLQTRALIVDSSDSSGRAVAKEAMVVLSWVLLGVATAINAGVLLVYAALLTKRKI